MRGTSLLVSVLVGGAGSWLKVPVALTATGAPSRTTNRSSVVPQIQSVEAVGYLYHRPWRKRGRGSAGACWCGTDRVFQCH